MPPYIPAESPPPPHEKTALLTANRCNELLHDSGHLFYTMWGQRGFKKRVPGEQGCWGKRGQSSLEFFDVVRHLNGPTAPKCNRNWFEGSDPPLGIPSSRPNFPRGGGAALMGFDETIQRTCNARLARQRGEPGYVYPGQRGHAIAHGCVEAGMNVMRVAGGAWDMCANLEWLVCATRGQLPGQYGDGAPRNRKIYFATEPGSLRTSEGTLRNSGAWYNSDSVFYIEVCLLSQICRNGDELLRTQGDKPFICDLGDAVSRGRAAWSLHKALAP